MKTKHTKQAEEQCAANAPIYSSPNVPRQVSRTGDQTLKPASPATGAVETKPESSRVGISLTSPLGFISPLATSDMKKNVPSSQSAVGEQTLLADKSIQTKPNSNHNMDKKSQSDVPLSHLSSREKNYIGNQGSCLMWGQDRVAETWDCWDRGMKLVLENGKNIILSLSEYNAWITEQIEKREGDISLPNVPRQVSPAKKGLQPECQLAGAKGAELTESVAGPGISWTSPLALSSVLVRKFDPLKYDLRIVKELQEIVKDGQAHLEGSTRLTWSLAVVAHFDSRKKQKDNKQNIVFLGDFAL